MGASGTIKSAACSLSLVDIIIVVKRDLATLDASVVLVFGRELAVNHVESRSIRSLNRLILCIQLPLVVESPGWCLLSSCAEG